MFNPKVVRNRKIDGAGPSMLHLYLALSLHALFGVGFGTFGSSHSIFILAS